ncbi:hypothetical protein [Streptomyces sp. R35]|uniref:Uncharacterized protein n=1 Tax=Streptomyces sp. R35 TaxID=3238630 RepID=A0AB39SA37_9ACTN
MTAEGMITWDSYHSGIDIFRMLTDVNEFALIADIPPVPELSDPVKASGMSSAIYDSVVTAVDSARFFSEDELTLMSGPSKCGVAYNDDRFDFELQLDNSRIMLHRQGSRFADFHDWYLSLMPNVKVLIASILEMLRKTTDREFKVFRAGFAFKFLLHDLKKFSGSPLQEESVRNSYIMSRLVSGVPSDTGRLSRDEKFVSDTSRTDVNITRWVEVERTPGQVLRRLERYAVEAPANKNGAGLWLTFGYSGETYSFPDGTGRIGFSHREFLDEWDTAYIDFLRDKAIKEFLATLTSDCGFRTSAGNLP